MSEARKNIDSQYENIVDWLKKDPICNVDETMMMIT